MEGFISGDVRLTADYYLGQRLLPRDEFPISVEVSAKFWDLDSAEEFHSAVRKLLDLP